MDIQLRHPDDSMTEWTDDEVIEVLHEHFYTLATTGEQAVLAVLDDIIHNRFYEHHWMDDERMGRIFIKFARGLKDYMNTTAIDYYHAEYLRKSGLATQTDEG